MQTYWIILKFKQGIIIIVNIHIMHVNIHMGLKLSESIIIIIIINTLQHRSVDGLPATCAGSQNKNLTT